MCKFFIQEAKTSSNKPELMETKFLKVKILEKENKLLEENLKKNLVQRKSAGSKSSQKLEDLLMLLKKLDEISLNLEEKNKKNELIIKKQNALIEILKQKFEEVVGQNAGVLDEQKKLEARIKELEKELDDKNLHNQEMKEILLNNCKISEVGTEDVELLNQSFCSECDVVRKSLKNEKKNRGFLILFFFKSYLLFL